MKAIYIDLDDGGIDDILRKHFEDQGFEYGGSQRDGRSPYLNVQIYVNDITKLRKE